MKRKKIQINTANKENGPNLNIGKVSNGETLTTPHYIEATTMWQNQNNLHLLKRKKTPIENCPNLSPGTKWHNSGLREMTNKLIPTFTPLVKPTALRESELNFAIQLLEGSQAQSCLIKLDGVFTHAVEPMTIWHTQSQPPEFDTATRPELDIAMQILENALGGLTLNDKTLPSTNDTNRAATPIAF